MNASHQDLVELAEIVADQHQVINTMIEAVREVQIQMLINVQTLVFALGKKGIITQEDLDAARAQATTYIDQESARIRDGGEV